MLTSNRLPQSSDLKNLLCSWAQRYTPDCRLSDRIATRALSIAVMQPDILLDLDGELGSELFKLLHNIACEELRGCAVPPELNPGLTLIE